MFGTAITYSRRYFPYLVRSSLLLLSSSHFSRWWIRPGIIRKSAKVVLSTLVPVTVMAKVQGSGNQPSVEEIGRHIDQLYHEDKMREAYNYIMQYAHIENVEVQWRVARQCYNVSKYYAVNNTEAEKIAREGLHHAELTVKLEPNNYRGHRWMGILVNTVSEFEGYKKKIEKSFDIRAHFQKSVELNPRDPYAHYLLGQWCYSVASVSWYMRKAASLIFATPPSATYEEALGHFKDAEEIEPGFYCSNWLFMGRCHYQLGHKEDAKQWLKKAAEYKSDAADDKEAIEEAKQLLKKL